MLKLQIPLIGKMFFLHYLTIYFKICSMKIDVLQRAIQIYSSVSSDKNMPIESNYNSIGISLQLLIDE